MKRFIAVVALLTMTTGCTLWWGGSYNEIESSPDMVKYEYKSLSLNSEGMDDAAADHCKQFGKYAHRNPRARGGSEYVTTYRCLPQLGLITPRESID